MLTRIPKASSFLFSRNFACVSRIILKGKDSPKLPHNTKLHRMYGHWLCPYVQKGRLTFAAKKIDYEFCCVDFPTRPKWFYDLPSAGKVPVLEVPKKPGDILFESKVIAEYAQDFAPDSGYPLYPKDSWTHAKMKLIMAEFDAMIPFFYRILRGQGAARDEGYNSLQKALITFEKHFKNEKAFLLKQDHPTLADMYCFPHLERISLFRESPVDSGDKKLNFSQFTGINKWLKRMNEREELKDALLDKEGFMVWLDKAFTQREFIFNAY
eukprot:TRINITY_DN3746_c0_g1_i1.p1 TRINITY_DN3746_c0_g1~~TRINITY_DN3746_c0_g1_i1.p1  ORF type:complete len:268 (-),score=19.14 TRINITY_DN3746_c0_g1_i1:2-805(-)